MEGRGSFNDPPWPSHPIIFMILGEPARNVLRCIPFEIHNAVSSSLLPPHVIGGLIGTIGSIITPLIAGAMSVEWFTTVIGMRSGEIHVQCTAIYFRLLDFMERR